MTIKWNRETFLVTLTLFAVLFGLFYYGNQSLIDPVKGEADSLSLLVDQQETVLSDYPPSESLLEEVETDYTLTESYLPLNDDSDSAMVTLQEHAGGANVTVMSVSRLNDHQAIEDTSDSFVKNTYQAEVTGESPENFRQLIDKLMNEQRVWNITSFAYEKGSESSYTGTFTFELFYHMEPTE